MSNENAVASACVPCCIGHFATSARLLDEAVRFKNEGLSNPQILDDVAAALGEQNALERIDLTPEKVRTLVGWEKEMAETVLQRSRELRHKLESLQTVEELEGLAADTEEFYKMLNREWLSKRLETCPTCAINAEAQPETAQHESPPVYGSGVAEQRRKFLDEIRSSHK